MVVLCKTIAKNIFYHLAFEKRCMEESLFLQENYCYSKNSQLYLFLPRYSANSLMSTVDFFIMILTKFNQEITQ
jgi:hypothetical protein